MTPEVAQIALRFGADDIDGTIVHETIYRAAGSRSPSGLTVRRSSCASSRRRGASRSSATRSTTSSASTRARALPEAALKVRDRKAREAPGGGCS